MDNDFQIIHGAPTYLGHRFYGGFQNETWQDANKIQKKKGTL